MLTLANWQWSALSVSIISGCSGFVGWVTDWRKLSSTPLKLKRFIVLGARLGSPAVRLSLFYVALCRSRVFRSVPHCGLRTGRIPGRES